MTQKAILFDCDGTLVDTEALCARVDIEILAEYGIHYKDTEDFLADFIGKAHKDILRILEERHGIALPFEDWLAAYKQRTLARIPAEMRFFRESVDYVRGLCERGFPVSIVSNGSREVVLRELEVGGYLDIVPPSLTFAVEDAPHPKPAPDLYLMGARALNVAPADCIVVEDSATGAGGAIAAGMTVIGYTGLNHAPEKAEKALLDAGCVKVINTLSALDSVLA